MNQVMELMKGLNTKEKQAVKAYRMLTHAYFNLYNNNDAADICLNLRHARVFELPQPSRSKAWKVATDIEAACHNDWIKTAKAAGLR